MSWYWAVSLGLVAKASLSVPLFLGHLCQCLTTSLLGRGKNNERLDQTVFKWNQVAGGCKSLRRWLWITPLWLVRGWTRSRSSQRHRKCTPWSTF
jgi:hypothetical protein